MAAAKHDDTLPFREPLLSESTQYADVLPPFPPSHRRGLLRKSCRRGAISCSVVFIFLVAAVIFLWPSKPKLSVVRLSLDRLRFNALPEISLDVTLNLTVRVRNRDFYSVDYDSLTVSIDYREKNLGNVTSDGGHVKARSSSYVNVTLDLDAVKILSDAILLVEDLAKGEITFETESRITGKIHVLFFDVPLKTTISCDVTVNASNQTIAQQTCYPEGIVQTRWRRANFGQISECSSLALFTHRYSP